MTHQEAIQYLEYVLETWSAFNKEHRKFEKALRVLLEGQEGAKNDTTRVSY